jgi:hypothetical protein
LRRAEDCTREALIEAMGAEAMGAEAMGATLWSVSDQDASGVFRHSGYRVTDQLL